MSEMRCHVRCVPNDVICLIKARSPAIHRRLLEVQVADEARRTKEHEEQKKATKAKGIGRYLLRGETASGSNE